MKYLFPYLLLLAIACDGQSLLMPPAPATVLPSMEFAWEAGTNLASANGYGVEVMSTLIFDTTNNNPLAFETTNEFTGTNGMVTLFPGSNWLYAASIDSNGVQSATVFGISFFVTNPVPVTCYAELVCQCSTDMLHWQTKVLQVFTNGPGHQFFRGLNVIKQCQ